MAELFASCLALIAQRRRFILAKTFGIGCGRECLRVCLYGTCARRDKLKFLFCFVRFVLFFILAFVTMVSGLHPVVSAAVYTPAADGVVAARWGVNYSF